MTITKNVDNNTITLSIEGWLDVETTQMLSAYMKDLETSDNLVFDFAKLEYISSSGVREVVSAYRRQKEVNGDFCVIHANEDVMDVFSMTGIDKKISITSM